MFLTNPLAGNIALGDAAIIALLGYAVVFFGIVLLMLVIMGFGKLFAPKAEKKNPAPAAAHPIAPVAPAASAAPAAAPVAVAPAANGNPNDPAPGSAGRIKLNDVPPKTAAMLMAIVANQLGKPLNELRFISIKEVK